jgi:O-antigen/teichoic acid export membrane protein
MDSVETTTELGVKSAGVATYLFFGKIISTIIGAVMFVIMAILLRPVGYGIYTLAISIAGLIGTVGDLGTDVYFNRHIAKFAAEKKFKKISIALGDGMMAITLISIVLIAIGILIGKVFLTKMFSGNLDAFYVALVSIFIVSLYNIQYNVLISFRDKKAVAISAVVNAAIQAIASISLVLIGFGPLGAVAGFVLGLSGAEVINIFSILKHSSIKFDIRGMFSRIKKMLSFSLPIAGSDMMSSAVGYLSVTVLGLMLVPTAIIGQYGVAGKVGAVIDVVSGSIGAVLISTFATALGSRKMKKDISNLYNYSVYFGMLLSLPVIIYVTVLSKSIVLAVFGASYSYVILYMPLIAIGILISTIATYSSSLVISIGKTKTVLKYTAIVSAVDIASFILIPLFRLFGEYATAIAVIFAMYYIGSFVSMYLYIKYLKNNGIKISYNRFTRLGVASVAFAICLTPLFFLGSMHMPRLDDLAVALLGALAMILLYPPIVAYSGAVSSKELDMLRNVGRKTPFIGAVINLMMRYASLFLR